MSYDPHHSRGSKAMTSIQGYDEFSVFSVQPDLSVKTVELEGQRVASQGAPEATDSDGIFMRFFRKMFRG